MSLAWQVCSIQHASLRYQRIVVLTFAGRVALVSLIVSFDRRLIIVVGATSEVPEAVAGEAPTPFLLPTRRSMISTWIL